MRKLGNGGSSPGIAGILRVQRSPFVFVVFHLHSMGRGSNHRLWHTHKVAVAGFRTHSQSLFQPVANAASRINRALLSTPDLWTSAAPAQWASGVGVLVTCLRPTCLLKPHSTHSLHRGHFDKRPLFQDWEKLQFYLIHINKRRKADKIKRQKKLI